VTDTAQRGPATVVVMQPVKRGHDQEVRRWQEAVNDAVSAFAGYLGNDFAPGNDGEWTVIYRFDSKPHLMDWLASPERAEVLRRGVHLFDGPATQHVLIRENDAEVVTIAVSHPVDPADQGAFLAWQDRVTEAERRFPGFRGSEIYRPVPGVQDEWTLLYRFDSDEHASAWLPAAGSCPGGWPGPAGWPAGNFAYSATTFLPDMSVLSIRLVCEVCRGCRCGGSGEGCGRRAVPLPCRPAAVPCPR
jgi:antibiotic biosynthesis monooxygenase (ABM) superfamily enzyme